MFTLSLNKKTLIFMTALLSLFTLNNAQAETYSAEEEAKLQQIFAQAVEGPKTINITNQATFELPKGMYFLPKNAANDYMELIGNGKYPTRLGLVMQKDEQNNWMADISFEDVGYISDEDAKNWDADELLDSLKEGNKEQNAERRKRNIPELELIGWVEKPTYQPATQRLVWSVNGKEVGSDASDENVINYNTYVLGRQGYIELNFITSEQAIQQEKAVAQDLLSRIKFNPGKTYGEFDAKMDKTAEFGLAALIGGAVVAKKLGLFAVIGVFLAKFWKIIAIAVFALFPFLKKRFGKKKANLVEKE